MRYDQLKQVLESISMAEKSIDSAQDTSRIMQYHLANRERIKHLICNGRSRISVTKETTRNLPVAIRPIPNRDSEREEALTSNAGWRIGAGSIKKH
jgi:hypothetical protein